MSHRKALLDSFDVVVCAALITPQQSLCHDILGAIEEQHEGGLLARVLFKGGPILVIPREAIYEKALLAARRHGRLQETVGNLRCNTFTRHLELALIYL